MFYIFIIMQIDCIDAPDRWRLGLQVVQTITFIYFLYYMPHSFETAYNVKQ